MLQGDELKIPNRHLSKQYSLLLKVLAHTAMPSPSEWLSLVYLLLAQDRVADGAALFATLPVPAGSCLAKADAGGGKMAEAMQYDYMAAYLDFLYVPLCAVHLRCSLCWALTQNRYLSVQQ